MTIKLQAPFNCTSASHDGIVYKADKKGIMVVPLEAANDLIKFHKFTNVPEKTTVEKQSEVLSDKIDKEVKDLANIKEAKDDELDLFEDDETL